MFPGTHALLTPDKPAAVMSGSGETLTYRQLDDASAKLARLLRDRGLRRGDTLAVITGNELTAFAVYWAAMRSGLYLTAVNHHLAADEVRYILGDSEARALIVSAQHRDLAEALLDSAAPLDTTLQADAAVAAEPGPALRLAFGGAVRGFESYEEAVEGFAAGPLPDQPAGSDMLYSSGTTGRPKGIRVPLPERQIDAPGDLYVRLVGPAFGLSAECRYLSPAPIYHAAPLRFAATVQALGGTVVLMESFDAEKALAAIEEYDISHVQMVPTMFVRLLKLPAATRERHSHASLEVVIHAAAPCPPEVKRAMIDWWGPILREYYGATEGNGGTMLGTADWLRKPGSVGQAFNGIVHICSEAGDELPTGEIGLVYFERDELPFRYHNDPVKTAAAQHPAHPTWTAVGDLGHVDIEDYLFLTERQAFVIISGGVNIYPQEIENALALHPDVSDVAVIGVPDLEMGQQVKAIVALAPGVLADFTETERLTAFLATRIARFKLPRTIDYVERLPRTPTGKLIKHHLLSQYAAAPVAPPVSGVPAGAHPPTVGPV